MRTRVGYITVNSAYAPTLLASDEDKDDFYQKLSDLLSSIPAGHDIAMPQRALKQCRSVHSADCGTDHTLVRYKLQTTPKKFYQTRPKPLPLVHFSSTRDSL